MNAPETSKTMTATAKFRETLKELIDKHRINAAELARRTKIPSPTIHRLLVGKTEDPKLSTLMTIANYFSISLDQLMGNTDIDPFEKKNPNMKNFSIPIITWTDACSIENLIYDDKFSNWVIIDINASKKSFGLLTKPSMEPRFPSGSILIIDPTAAPQDSNLVIVSYSGAKEATIRKIVLDGPKQQLLSITDNSLTDASLSGIQILGIVIQTRYSYT